MNKLYYILVVLICTAGFAQTSVYTSFSTGEVSPDLHGRIDARKFYSGCRILENFFVWAQGPVEKRRGTYFVGEVGGEIFPEVPEGEAISPTYNLTYISENGQIWAVPIGDGEMTAGLDSGGVASNIGGGIVGLPYAGHPFAIGEIVRITNTTNYNGLFTLDAGTTGNELQITSGYTAETFDGTEVIVQYISVDTGVGRMCRDSDGNLYYGHTGANNTYITKIETDGTVVYDFFTADPVWSGFTGTVMGIKVDDDNDYLYLWINVPGPTNYGYMYKFDLTTGDQVWRTTPVYGETSVPGYDIAVDASGNVYAKSHNRIRKFDSADGSGSFFTLMGEGKAAYATGGCPYAIAIDDDMDIVVCGGEQLCLAVYDESILYNLAVRDLANTEGVQTALGGTYTLGGIDYTYIIGTGCILTYTGHIYILSNTPTCTLYKLDTDLNIINSVAGPTYGVGLYIDLWGNIVVVNQYWTVGQSDIFYFYDTDLNSLSNIDGFYALMLRNWAAAVGGTWSQGNAVFDGYLGTAGTPAIPAVIELADNVIGPPPARLLSFEYSEEDSHIIEAGTGYFKFYKDVQ